MLKGCGSAPAGGSAPWRIPRGAVQPAAAQFPRRSRRRRCGGEFPCHPAGAGYAPSHPGAGRTEVPRGHPGGPPQPTPLWKRWQLWIAAAAVPLVVLAAVLAPIDRQTGTPVSSTGVPLWRRDERRLPGRGRAEPPGAPNSQPDGKLPAQRHDRRKR